MWPFKKKAAEPSAEEVRNYVISNFLDSVEGGWNVGTIRSASALKHSKDIIRLALIGKMQSATSVQECESVHAALLILCEFVDLTPEQQNQLSLVGDVTGDPSGLEQAVRENAQAIADALSLSAALGRCILEEIEATKKTLDTLGLNQKRLRVTQ